MTIDAEDILSLVEVGQDVWHIAPLEPIDFPGRRGGIVFAIDSDLDTETGELARVFHVIDYRQGQLRFDRLRAAEVNPETVGLLNAGVVRSASRRLAGDYSKTKGYLNGDHVRLLEVAMQLARVVA